MLVVKLLIDSTTFAWVAVLAFDAETVVGIQAVPFQPNAWPADGGVVNVSTSAKTLMLASDKLENTRALV